MKGKAKANPTNCSKAGKSKSSEKLQTISAMFHRQTARNQFVKSDRSDVKQDSDDVGDDDVIIIEDEEKTSSYFSRLQPKGSKYTESPKKSSFKRSGINMDAKPRKKSKLSLSRAGSNNVICDSNLKESSLECKVSDKASASGLSSSWNQESRDDEQSCEVDAVDRPTSSSTDTLLPVKIELDKSEKLTDVTVSNRTNTSNTDWDEDGRGSKLVVPPDNDTSKDHNTHQLSGSSIGASSEETLSNTNASPLVVNKDSVSDKDEQLASATSQELQQFKEPYYFINFGNILISVMEDESNMQLFNEEDKAIIDRYKSLSDAAKKLYIRMFCRKLNWIPQDKLNYPEIGSDLHPVLTELVQCSFIYDEKDLTDLHEVLKTLTAADVKALAKVYHVAPNITQKGQQIAELLKLTQRSNVSNMFGGARGGLAKAMTSRAKKFLCGVYKLRDMPRALFVRIMTLFSVVNTSLDEDTGIGGQGQLFQMLMVNMGKVVYPEYTVDKKHPIFGNRDDILRFAQALQLEYDLLRATDKGMWEDAHSVFLTVQETWKLFEGDESIVRWNKNLPDYLRSFTATSVLYRLLSQGIEILQRRKDFDGAVALLKALLGQGDYCCSYRGYWWERLALNLDAHLKKPEQSLEAVLSGLADPHVRTGHRLALYLRGQSICQRPRLKLGHHLQECVHPPVKEMPKVYLEGRVLDGATGAGPRFLTEASYRGEGDGAGVGDMAVCGVEEFVLDHYRNHSFPGGMHAEGSIVCSLFALFCWDILFLSRPDAFQSPYQAMPLDFYTDAFYERRKEEIDTRLEELANSSVEELQTMVEESWTQHEGITCIGMNWDKMRSADFVKEIVSCMGAHALSGILTRHAQSPRHTRGGFPDLTLWNPATKDFKICEVKGPGDRLSQKQILWIDYLLSLGVDAEVCHVKAVAAKRLLPSSSAPS